MQMEPPVHYFTGKPNTLRDCCRKELNSIAPIGLICFSTHRSTCACVRACVRARAAVDCKMLNILSLHRISHTCKSPRHRPAHALRPTLTNRFEPSFTTATDRCSSIKYRSINQLCNAVRRSARLFARARARARSKPRATIRAQRSHRFQSPNWEAASYQARRDYEPE
jgi:hypothetical protein